MKFLKFFMCTCFIFSVNVVAMNPSGCYICASGASYIILNGPCDCRIISPFLCSHKFHFCCLEELFRNGAKDRECPLCHAQRLPKESLIKWTYDGNEPKDNYTFHGFDGTCNTLDDDDDVKKPGQEEKK